MFYIRNLSFISALQLQQTNLNRCGEGYNFPQVKTLKLFHDLILLK